jgi:NarL family two-component system sensor histidine kinase LiaS
MKPVFPSLRKLQWQLSLFYLIATLITIPALLGMGLAVILLNTPSPSSSPSPGEQLVQILETHVAPAITGQVQQSPPNSKSLYVWAADFMRGPAQFDLNVTEVDGVAIIDHQGQILASASGKGSQISRQELAKITEAQAIINAAFVNNTRLSDQVYTFADGHTIAAVPLLDTQNRPIDVLYVMVRGLQAVKVLQSSASTDSNLVTEWLPRIFGEDQQHSVTLARTMLPYAVCIILVISTTFGLMTARRLTRRLRRITSAAHAWSQGQLQVTVTDHSPDELGQLAQDLNQMAGQVQTLLQTQRQFSLIEERQRVARDLHDSVKQQTFAFALLVGAAKKSLSKDPARAQTYLSEAEELAQQTRQELTSIIYELRPLELAEKGLMEALQSYLQRWSRNTGIAAEFAAQYPHPLMPELEESLLRVVQEALANVARHSHASRVEVRLLQEPGLKLTHLEIQDNGQGFDPLQAKGKGLGLATMHERIEAQQGTMRISSSSDGTHLEMCIPSRFLEDVAITHVGKEDPDA